MIARRVLVTMICVTVLLTGCTTMNPVDLATDQSMASVLQPNDFVRVWMRDGRVLELKLTAIEPDALVGAEQRLPLKDVVRVEKRGFSAPRTTLLVLAITASVLAALVLALSHATYFAPGAPH